jgi:alkylation response protein AidB-like acyl-CoA dehydrogenase
VHLAPTRRQQRLRAELRACFRTVLPERGEPAGPRVLPRRIGADGRLGLGRPVEYGGRGRGTDEQFVFFDEAHRAGAPCQEIAGEAGLVRAGSPGVFGDGEPERLNRAAQINTFGGGVSEVQREIVATMRLGMARTARAAGARREQR